MNWFNKNSHIDEDFKPTYLLCGCPCGASIRYTELHLEHFQFDVLLAFTHVLASHCLGFLLVEKSQVSVI